mmetsp:Transcript_11452/g.16608  ORF Transcript_11452/g.16608 Transcript_11452/m.16608 type:complete len:173 (+) Transcript_11452:733-1251(+)
MQVCMSYNFAQSDDVIPKSWLLLDTCSSSSITNNSALVTGLCDFTEEEVLTVRTNGDTKTFTQIGHLCLFPLEVHFNPDSLANDDVDQIDGVYITLDTLSARAFNVQYHDAVYNFKPCFEGIYYLDTANLKPMLLIIPFLKLLKPIKNISLLKKIKERKMPDYYNRKQPGPV